MPPDSLAPPNRLFPYQRKCLQSRQKGVGEERAVPRTCNTSSQKSWSPFSLGALRNSPDFFLLKPFLHPPQAAKRLEPVNSRDASAETQSHRIETYEKGKQKTARMGGFSFGPMHLNSTMGFSVKNRGFRRIFDCYIKHLNCTIPCFYLKEKPAFLIFSKMSTF